MFKKLSAVILAFSIIFTGCTGATQTQLSAKEVMLEIQKQSLAQDKANFDMVGTFNMEAPDADQNDPNTAAVLNMMKDMKYSLTGAYKGLEAGDFAFSGEGSFEMNGITVKGSLYLDQEDLIIDYPALGKLVDIKFEELINLINTQTGSDVVSMDLVKKIAGDYKTVFAPKISDKFVENLPEEALELIPEYSFKFKDEEVKDKALKLVLNETQYQDLMMAVIKDLANDEEIYNTIAKYEIPDFPATFDEFKTKVNDALEDPKAKEQMEKAFSASSMNMETYYSYDDKYLPTMLNITTTQTTKVPTQEKEMTFTMSQDIQAKMNYDEVEITKPEITADNSMGIQELMMMIMGGMAQPQ